MLHLGICLVPFAPQQYHDIGDFGPTEFKAEADRALGIAGGMVTRALTSSRCRLAASESVILGAQK
jgi:hypothetical protein